MTMGLSLRYRAHQGPGVLGVVLAVRIQRDRPVGQLSGFRETGHERRALALVEPVAQDPDARDGSDPFEGRVGRPIVDHHHRNTESHRPLHHVGDRLLMVVYGDDDGEPVFLNAAVRWF